MVCYLMVYQFTPNISGVMWWNHQVFIGLHSVIDIEEIKDFVDVFTNVIIGGKQSVIRVYFSRRLIEISSTDKGIAFDFITF